MKYFQCYEMIFEIWWQCLISAWIAKICSNSILSADHVTVNFARSGGPGGQNVNKGFIFSTFSFFLLHIDHWCQFLMCLIIVLTFIYICIFSSSCFCIQNLMSGVLRSDLNHSIACIFLFFLFSFLFIR
jgi:hypothetical protein